MQCNLQSGPERDPTSPAAPVGMEMPTLRGSAALNLHAHAPGLEEELATWKDESR